MLITPVTYTPVRLYVGQPGTSLSALYTVPEGEKVIVRNIVLANTTSSLAKVSVHFVPAGGTADNTNKVIADYGLSPNTTVVIDMNAVLEAGDSVQAIQAVAGAVTMYLSGVEVK